MPHGKPAGARCVQLTREDRCSLFGDPRRPAVCSGLRPEPQMCGNSRAQALRYLTALERATQPARSVPDALFLSTSFAR
jgi:hypothetical protein